MNSKLFSLLVLFAMLCTVPAFAKTTGKKPTKTVSANPVLSTSVNFDDSVLYGRYNSADEAVATVEDEKSMGQLLGLRLDFKDRLKKSAELK